MKLNNANVLKLGELVMGGDGGEKTRLFYNIA